MSMKSVAAIAAIMSAVVAPAFADDAEKAAVLRDLGSNAAENERPSDANALAAPTARAQRPAQYHAQRPVQVIVNEPSPFDFSYIGHN
jgi:hypothetical protein